MFDLEHLQWQLQSKKQRSHSFPGHVYHSAEAPNIGWTIKYKTYMLNLAK